MKKTTQTTESFIASLMPDSDRRMWRIAGVSFLVAIALCFWAAAYERLIEDVIFEKTETVEIEATMNIVEHKEENKQTQKQEKKKREIKCVNFVKKSLENLNVIVDALFVKSIQT